MVAKLVNSFFSADFGVKSGRQTGQTIGQTTFLFFSLDQRRFIIVLTTTCFVSTRDFCSSFCSSTTKTHVRLDPRPLARHLSPQSTQAFDQQPSKTSRREEECSERTMTFLTEELILQKTKSERLESVRNLNVWGCALEDLSVLKVPPRPRRARIQGS